MKHIFDKVKVTVNKKLSTLIKLINDKHKVIKLIITFIFSFMAITFCTIISTHMSEFNKNTDIATYTNTLVGIASSIATSIICILTIISLVNIHKTNAENKKENTERDKKNTFEKQFSILLNEHNNYLSKLIACDNELYKPDVICRINGFEILSIIRGDMYKYKIGNRVYYYLNNEVYLKMRINSGDIEIYDTDNPITCEHEHKYRHEYIASLNGEIFTINKRRKLGNTYFQVYLSDVVKLEIEDYIKSNRDVVKDIIRRNNDIAKNILSPYMRIIYHILKLSNNNTSNVAEMKQYTNIIRSIIPYDILMLIAINAMFFYENKSNKSNGMQTLLNPNINKITLHTAITNDYYKYYNLLVRCEFFEHLTMDFRSIKDKIKEITLDLSDFTNLKNGYENGRLLQTKGNYSLSCFNTIVDIYYIFSNAIYDLDTDILISLSYKYSFLEINHLLRGIMKNTDHNFKLQIEQGNLSKYIDFYSPDWEYINISNKFIYNLIKGILIFEDKDKTFKPINNP